MNTLTVTLSVCSVLVLTSYLGSVAAILVDRRGWSRPRVRRIDDKFSAAQTAMTELADYLSVLQRGISDEQSNLTRTTDEYQRYKALAGTERDKAAAFLAELGLTIRAGAGRERLWSFGISLVTNVIVFVVGVAASDVVRSSWFWLAGR
jgi:hypothetical protein